MINQIIKFVVKKDCIEIAKNQLLSEKKRIEQQPESSEYRLFIDNNNPQIFFVFVGWKDKSAAEEYNSKPHYQQFLNTLDSSLVSPAEAMTLGATSPGPATEVKQYKEEDDPFTIFFIFKFKPEMRQRLLERFDTHITKTRQEEGNVLFDLYTIEGAPDTLAVYEHWRNESAVWDVHFKQPYSEVTGALMHEAVIGDLEQYMNFVTEIS